MSNRFVNGSNPGTWEECYPLQTPPMMNSCKWNVELLMIIFFYWHWVLKNPVYPGYHPWNESNFSTGFPGIYTFHGKNRPTIIRTNKIDILIPNPTPLCKCYQNQLHQRWIKLNRLNHIPRIMCNYDFSITIYI